MKICKHPLCPNPGIKNKNYCNDHRPRELRAGRLYASKKWKNLSKNYLIDNPICVQCDSQATVVDHIEPHLNDPLLFWDISNFQALCKHHHDQKTAKDTIY